MFVFTLIIYYVRDWQMIHYWTALACATGLPAYFWSVHEDNPHQRGKYHTVQLVSSLNRLYLTKVDFMLLFVSVLWIHHTENIHHKGKNH